MEHPIQAMSARTSAVDDKLQVAWPGPAEPSLPGQSAWDPEQESSDGFWVRSNWQVIVDLLQAGIAPLGLLLLWAAFIFGIAAVSPNKVRQCKPSVAHVTVVVPTVDSIGRGIQPPAGRPGRAEFFVLSNPTANDGVRMHG